MLDDPADQAPARGAAHPNPAARTSRAPGGLRHRHEASSRWHHPCAARSECSGRDCPGQLANGCCRTRAGVSTAFENLEGFPEDWKTNPGAFIRFVREHQCPSFIEYGEYPYFTADEIKKALRIKSALSEMLDQMQ